MFKRNKKKDEKIKLKVENKTVPLPVKTIMPEVKKEVPKVIPEVIKTEIVKPKKVIKEVYTVCPECRTDVKGNLLSCPYCKNTRKKLKEWIEEREVE